MTDPVVWFVLLVSGPVGSFLACYADRTCKAASLVTPSRCDMCGAQIATWDLLPVFSWLLLRGRCRACKEPIRRGLFLAELLAIGAACIAIATTRASMDLAIAAIFLWCLLGLALTDFACFRLPDALTLALFLSGMGLAAMDAGRTLAGAAGSAALAATILLGLRMGYKAMRGHEGLGLGDVKLAAGLGAGLGVAALPWLGLIASGCALAAAALGLFGPPQRRTALPFGVFLCLAAAVMYAVRLWH